MRYAIINSLTNLVTNVCEWDGDTLKWSPPSGYFTIQTLVGDIGDTWDGTTFLPAPPIPPPPPGPIFAKIDALTLPAAVKNVLKEIVER